MFEAICQGRKRMTRAKNDLTSLIQYSYLLIKVPSKKFYRYIRTKILLFKCATSDNSNESELKYVQRLFPILFFFLFFSSCRRMAVSRFASTNLGYRNYNSR